MRLGCGCRKCARVLVSDMQRFTLETFISRSRAIHGDKYDYSKTIYTNHKSHVTIICRDHGLFKQSPSKHLIGRNCPRCARVQSSKRSFEWLNYVAASHGIKLQTAQDKQGEYLIPGTRLKCDGFCHETNTCYEFLGDYWHGNPNVYAKDAVNKTTNITFGELYNKTLQRKHRLESLGYNYVEMWEHDWNKLVSKVVLIQKAWRRYAACLIK